MTHISALENQMETKSLSRQRDFSYYINPYTNLKANEASGPLVIERGDGVFVYDEDGKEYLEGCPGSGVSPSGSANRADPGRGTANENPALLPQFHRQGSRGHP